VSGAPSEAPLHSDRQSAPRSSGPR
jgi:hypothetical protein